MKNRISTPPIERHATSVHTRLSLCLQAQMHEIGVTHNKINHRGSLKHAQNTITTKRTRYEAMENVLLC